MITIEAATEFLASMRVFARNVERAFSIWKYPTGRNPALWRVSEGR